MSCDQYRHLSDRHWLGEASPAEVEELRCHIATCSICQSADTALSSLEHAFRAEQLPQATTELEARIMKAVLREALRRTTKLWHELLAIAAILVVAVLTGPFLETALGMALGETSELTSWPEAMRLPSWVLGLIAMSAMLLNAFWAKKEAMTHHGA